jgi:hypothetical protein
MSSPRGLRILRLNIAAQRELPTVTGHAPGDEPVNWE